MAGYRSAALSCVAELVKSFDSPSFSKVLTTSATILPTKFPEDLYKLSTRFSTRIADSKWDQAKRWGKSSFNVRFFRQLARSRAAHLTLESGLLAEHGLTANPPSFSLPSRRRAFARKRVRCCRNGSATENQNRPIPDSCQGRLNDGLKK